MSEQFIQNVQLCIRILEEEKERSKQLAELRAHKKRIKEEIKAYMRQQQLDEATVPDTATLSTVPRRRILGLKRKAVEDWAKRVMGGDERSLQEVGKLYDAREVKVTDELLVEQLQ